MNRKLYLGLDPFVFFTSLRRLAPSIQPTHGIDTEAMLQHIHHHDECNHANQRQDRDGRERSRYYLLDHCRRGFDLAVSTGVAHSKALACIIEQRRSADAVVLASDVDAHASMLVFTANSLPSREAEAAEGAARRLIAFTCNGREAVRELPSPRHIPPFRQVPG